VLPAALDRRPSIAAKAPSDFDSHRSQRDHDHRAPLFSGHRDDRALEPDKQDAAMYRGHASSLPVASFWQHRHLVTQNHDLGVLSDMSLLRYG
jgi:hypothetical protein